MGYNKSWEPEETLKHGRVCWQSLLLSALSYHVRWLSMLARKDPFFGVNWGKSRDMALASPSLMELLSVRVEIQVCLTSLYGCVRMLRRMGDEEPCALRSRKNEDGYSPSFYQKSWSPLIKGIMRHPETSETMSSYALGSKCNHATKVPSSGAPSRLSSVIVACVCVWG